MKEVTYLKMLKDQFFHQCFSIPDGTGIFPDGTIHQTQTVKDWFHTEIVQRWLHNPVPRCLFKDYIYVYISGYTKFFVFFFVLKDL